jgi:prephenate dehydratase
MKKLQNSFSRNFGVVAIENTISGTINQNLDLIANHNVHICGEQKLRIIQNLGVLPGARIEDLKEVRSHYMAINQCRSFLSQYPYIKIVDEEDTALSARRIAEQQLKDVGAIGSIEAMEYYGLEVLASGIETNKQNFTRFYVITKGQSNISEVDTKFTIKLILNHDVGCLANLLTGFKEIEASLCKIESAPIVGKPWQYLFFIEVDVVSNNHAQNLIRLLESSTSEFKILGHYAPAKIHTHAAV